MKKLVSMLLALMLLAAVTPGMLTAASAEAPQTNAWLMYTPVTGWPENVTSGGNDNIATSNATITGEGYYTVALTYQHAWVSTEGALRLHIVIDDGNTLFPNMYLHVTDVRVDGVSIDCGSVSYGPGGNTENVGTNDTHAVLYDLVQVNDNSTHANHNTWDGSALQPSVINPDDIPYGGKTLEVDFFLAAQQNVEPPKPGAVKAVWYPNNTASVAGLSLKDLGIANDWHNIVPVDLTQDGVQTFTMVASDARIIGNVFVIVNDGTVSVQCEYMKGMIYEKSQCVKWFTDLSQLTAEELTSIEGGLTCADAVSIQDDLGGAEIAYLSLNNKVTYREPVDIYGRNLPRYWRNHPDWVAYREQLMSVMPAAEAAE